MVVYEINAFHSLSCMSRPEKLLRPDGGNERAGERTDEQADVRADKRMDEETDVRADKRMDEETDGRESSVHNINERADRFLYAVSPDLITPDNIVASHEGNLKFSLKTFRGGISDGRTRRLYRLSFSPE